jgi:hypothetical protein
MKRRHRELFVARGDEDPESSHFLPFLDGRAGCYAEL